MFVRVEEDILQTAVTSPPNSRTVLTLSEISVAITRGKHYVFIPQWILYRDRLKGILPDQTYRILDGLKRQDGNGLDKIIRRKLIVTDNSKLSRNRFYIVFSPSRNSSFEIFHETLLVCENIKEAEFYEKVEAYYRREWASTACRATRCSLYPSNGGGATTVSVLQTERKFGRHLLLIIADSDYKYSFRTKKGIHGKKDKGEKGDTAKALECEQRKNPYPFAEVYVMKEAREVENLIPKKFLRDLNPNNDNKVLDLLDNFCTDFLDIKEGIRKLHLLDDKILKYWTPALVANQYDISEIAEIKQKYKSKNGYKVHLKNCSVQERDANIIIEGWGNNILERSLQNKKAEYDNITSDDLTNPQLGEWKKIGNRLFEWGLSTPSKFT